MFKGSNGLKIGVAIILLAAVLGGSWLAFGRSGRPQVQCASPEATATTIDALKKALEKETFAKVKGAESTQSVSKSSIRAAIAQMVFSLEDVRTTKHDPNSTKQFCEGTLKIRFPAEDVTNADEARASAGLGTITQLADANDVDREANSFSAKAEYEVQPTDTGDKVFAETDTKSPLMNVASEILGSSLLHNVLQQAAATQQEQAQAQEAQQTEALAEQKAANLNSAKTDNQLASQSILAVWRALPAITRAQLLAQQRAWARKKDADCRVEAAGSSTDPNEMEVTRLNCDTRATQERVSLLQSVRTQSTESEEPDPSTEN